MESRDTGTPIPAILCIDVEPDARDVDPACTDGWTGFEKLLPEIERLRDALAAATGAPARFTWTLRMDPQVAETWGSARWLAEEYETDWAALTTAGDELGLHPHPWRRDATGWISDQGDEDWVASCVHLALETYRAAFGRPCASYRQGDRSMTTALACLLDDAGVVADLTVEPGLPGSRGLVAGERATGWIEDTMTAPTVPYRPSRDDFRVPDTERRDGLLMIPLTRALDIDVVAQADRVRPSGRWTTLALWDDPATFRARLLRRLANPVVTHLAFAIRTDITLRPEWWSAFEANLAEVCRHHLAPRLRWCTASAAARLLAPATGDARPGNLAPSGSSRRAGLWAGGAEDPGYLEGAETDALELVGRVAAGQNTAARDLAAALDAERGRAQELAVRLDRADDDRRAMRATTAWRARDAWLRVRRRFRRLVTRR